MAIEAEELATISRSIKSAGQQTAGEFRRVANDNNANLTRIVKDISNTFKAQREDLADLRNVLEEMVSESQQTGNKIDSLNSLFRESLEIQNAMATQMSNVSRNTKILSGDIENLNRNIMNTTAGTGLLGSITGIGKDVASQLLAMGVGAVAGAGAMTAATSLGGGGSSGGGELTSYSGNEQSAKAAADRYAGRTLSANEWSELVKATNAEAGQKNQTEAAMVMASIINRSRDKNKSISDVLREPNQFQAVTGTRFSPGPSQAFQQGPGEKRAEQIYGAAANILEKVSKQQKDFTAASSAAYGAGTNIGYRNKMISAGGSVVGASVFNTAAPTLDTSTTPNHSNADATKVTTPSTETVPSANDSRTESIGKEGGHGPISGAMHGGGEHGEHGKLSGIQPGILQKFQQIQSQAGTPLTVTSGFRDPAHNAAVGGAKNSAHTRGNAVDVTFGGGIPETLKLIETASKAGIGGIGVYRPGVLHFDTESKRAWGPNYHSDSIPGWAREVISKHLGSSSTGGGETPVAEATATTPSSTSNLQPKSAVEVGSSQSYQTSQTATPVEQPTVTSSLSAPSAPQIPMQMMGMMGGGIGGIAGMLLPMIASTIQSEMVSMPSMPALNTQAVNQAAITAEATQQTVQEAQSSAYTPQVNPEANRMAMGDNSGFAYNMPDDIGWPDWAGMIGGNHWEEMKNYKKNMSWT